MKALVLAAAMLPAPAFAQSQMHAGHTATAPMPAEPGQGGFGAMAEIVEILRSDDDTDWSRVDLRRLRAHLQDMDALMTELAVSEQEVPGGLEMTVERSSQGADAAWRMVPAHGPVLSAETGWTSEVTVGDDMIVWTVTDATDADEIRALGFFGLMATGNHHPAHHLALARGEIPH